ncbi:MAG: fused response regulator/phosphatase [Gammaproteobacteria bacterium]
MSQSEAQRVEPAQSSHGNTPPDSLALPNNTVLIVEDSKVEQVRLEAILTKFGYRVLSADNGNQALDILRHEDILLVVSDWRMPEMTGIDLCRQLRNEPGFGHPYVILVTGLNAKADLVAGMDAGADDFISKPFNSEELRVRLQAGVRIVQLRNAVEQQYMQLAQTLKRETETSRMIRKDLDAAAMMQRELLPASISPFPQLEVSSLFQPAATVAGDSFNFFRLDDEHLAFYHIDVSGHGIASAMLSFTVSRFLSPEMGAITLSRSKPANPVAVSQHLPSHIVSPEKVVSSLNERFLEKEDCTHYFTMVYGVLNANTGAGHLCQAGHPHPLITDSTGKVRQIGKSGFPVGMLENASYESTAFQLGQGERLFLYSDGITDCSSEDGTPFTLQRLATQLGDSKDRSLPGSIASLDGQLKHWHGDFPLEDDISLLAIKRLEIAGIKPGSDIKTDVISMTAVATDIPGTAERIAGLGASAGMDDLACFQVKVVMAEVLNNIVNHASPASNAETIEIHYRFDYDHFEVTTRDHGKPFDNQPTHEFPHARAESGRGWPIILNWMDSVEYQSHSGCNHLTLKKTLS